MSFDKTAFEQLQKNRHAYVEGLRRNKGFEAGILRLLTQLYPDNAHFIYELLQNAEDAKATHAKFTLAEEFLIFEHDGTRLFTARDVESITSIGDSSKADSPTEIGKFGVGFKAVFAYTQTPEVYSGEYQFRIHDLVVPDLLLTSSPLANGFSTKFVFPFNHQKKIKQQATSEISRALLALDETALLFLSNISKISFELPEGNEGILERVQPPDLQHAGSKGEHIEVRVNALVGEPRRSHWLRYKSHVSIEDETKRKDCTVAVAFGLAQSEAHEKKAKWQITSLQPGRVCIYFPAEKETSNLRFHMHAPFASTVARDSVRNSPGNEQLLGALAELAAESMEDIRDRSLLTVSALGVLPIADDNLSPFYAPVRARIIEAFKTENLVPTKSGGHRKVKDLFRGPSDIVNLISDEDLVTLTGGKWAIPLWCANPPQVNQRADKFLNSLSINRWEWKELCASLRCDWQSLERAKDHARLERLNGWLAAKDDAWLQRFYALLHDALAPHYHVVSEVALVRVDADSHVRMVKPAEAFFPPPREALVPKDVLLVTADTYLSGKSESQNNAARFFLEKAGVRVFDEEIKIGEILNLYSGNTFPNQKIHLDHIKRFIDFHKAFPQKTQIFDGKKIFLGKKVGTETGPYWCTVNDLLLDMPFEETGLSVISGILDKKLLWCGYEKVAPKKAFVEFVKALGMQVDLPIIPVGTKGNHLMKQAREYHFYLSGLVKHRHTYTGTDDDWTIYKIRDILKAPVAEVSLLLWKTIIRSPSHVAKARYRPNQQHTLLETESQLVFSLSRRPWIPDVNGDFHKPQDISRDQLPPGFLFDDRNGLLRAIGFEEAIQQQSDEYRRKELVVRELGFNGLGDVTELVNAMRETGTDVKAAVAFFKQHAAKPEQPQEPVRDPARRRKGVMEHRENAPENLAVQRERSFQPNLTGVVAEAKAYLRAKYTNSHGQMVCQACSNEMPFKLPNGEYYFEAVQVLKGLAQHFYENRLALCPTCAAMYQFARSNTDEELRSAINAVDGEQGESTVAVPIVLAGEHRMVHFVGTHFFDLQLVLAPSAPSIG